MWSDRNGMGPDQPSRRNVELPEFDWQDIDWLEEPAPRPAQRQRPVQQDEYGQRPVQRRPAQQGGNAQRPVQRRPAQQSGSAQRPAQQRPAQQRPVQQDEYGQRPVQRRPAQQSGSAQRPAQQHPAQRQQDEYGQRPVQRRPAQQSGSAQRPAQQRPAQQRPAQRQRPVQQDEYGQRPVQRRPAQQGGNAQRPAQRQRPVQQQYQQPSRRQSRPVQEPWRDDRYREVGPEEYRPKRRFGLQKQNLPLIILVVILVGGVLFAGGKLGSILLNYHRDRSAYNSLADEALSGLAEPNATADPNATPDPNGQQTSTEVPISVNWEYLEGINSEVVGWLYCPDTAINYPVMQATDNDYYLHRGFDRQPNTAGSLFADYNATEGVVFSNYIIYGHNMKDGSMFAAVYDYVDQSYYDQHPVMYFLTPTQNYRVELIAAHIVEGTMDNYPGYFQGDGAYQSYLNEITSRSFFGTHFGVSSQYQLITMSTCDYSSNYANPRFLLHGQLVPIQ